jgi:hypothetical protein
MIRLCLVAVAAAAVSAAAASRTTIQTETTMAWVEIMQQMQEQQDKARNERLREQRKRTTAFWEKQAMRPPPLDTMERVEWDEDSFNGTSPTELWKRKLWWSANKNGDAISSQKKGEMADPSQYYDKWAQAYRMLGGYIDCDHYKSSNNKGGGSHDNNNNGGSVAVACSRWMMWAAVRGVK